VAEAVDGAITLTVSANSPVARALRIMEHIPNLPAKLGGNTEKSRRIHHTESALLGRHLL
jgi:hypothetical protein